MYATLGGLVIREDVRLDIPIPQAMLDQWKGAVEYCLWGMVAGFDITRLTLTSDAGYVIRLFPQRDYQYFGQIIIRLGDQQIIGNRFCPVHDPMWREVVAWREGGVHRLCVVPYRGKFAVPTVNIKLPSQV
jgi:hypothetical protein